MTPSPARAWRALATEAIADATRRRIVPVIAVLALFSLLFVESCTSCSPTLTRDGESVELPQVAGFGGLLISVVLGLWTMVLAGVLASDHLAEPLEDGSADLALARPVSRGAFALSRLLGALALACATGALLLFGSAVLLYARQGLAPGPVFAAFLACMAGAATMSGLAMTASLVLPRSVTALAVFGFVWVVAGINAVAQFGTQLTGFAGLVDRFGPPLATAMIVALGSWIEPTATRGEPLELALRSLVWAGAGALLLLGAFRRIELGR
jgi:ABC-type transport system involved in multi-copper enzyme maturation permease subunit